MLYAKTFRNHLNKGGRVEDWLYGEPGMCSNGGHYYDIYKIRDGILMVKSSYEDADWQDAEITVDEFARWAHENSNDIPVYIKGARFELR